MSNTSLKQVKEAKETFQTLMDLVRALGIDFDAETLAICIRLCDDGINPEVLATLLKTLINEIIFTENTITEEHQ